MLNYDQDGVLHSAELQDDHSVVQAHVRWRDAALAQAIPVGEYLRVSSSR
jgi:hypothetical protein